MDHNTSDRESAPDIARDADGPQGDFVENVEMRSFVAPQLSRSRALASLDAATMEAAMASSGATRSPQLGLTLRQPTAGRDLDMPMPGRLDRSRFAPVMREEASPLSALHYNLSSTAPPASQHDSLMRLWATETMGSQFSGHPFFPGLRSYQYPIATSRSGGAGYNSPLEYRHNMPMPYTSHADIFDPSRSASAPNNLAAFNTSHASSTPSSMFGSWQRLPHEPPPLHNMRSPILLPGPPTTYPYAAALDALRSSQAPQHGVMSTYATSFNPYRDERLSHEAPALHNVLSAGLLPGPPDTDAAALDMLLNSQSQPYGTTSTYGTSVNPYQDMWQHQTSTSLLPDQYIQSPVSSRRHQEYSGQSAFPGALSRSSGLVDSALDLPASQLTTAAPETTGTAVSMPSATLSS
jgi:hypothetical protein